MGKLFSHRLSLVTQITWASISRLIHRFKSKNNELHSQYLHQPWISWGRQNQPTKPLKNKDCGKNIFRMYEILLCVDGSVRVVQGFRSLQRRRGRPEVMREAQTWMPGQRKGLSG